MTADDVEQQIRRHPTANERFLLGIIDTLRKGAAMDDRIIRERGDRIDSLLSGSELAEMTERAMSAEDAISDVNDRLAKYAYRKES